MKKETKEIIFSTYKYSVLRCGWIGFVLVLFSSQLVGCGDSAKTDGNTNTLAVLADAKKISALRKM